MILSMLKIIFCEYQTILKRNLIGKVIFCLKETSLFSYEFYLFSHKRANVIVNDIKRNLLNFEDTLGQCSVESRTRYEGDITELKFQLERMMVKIVYSIVFSSLIHYLIMFSGFGKTP